MESLTLEEIALHRIFDLKNEVVHQFESHRRLFDEALVSNLFLKNLDPPVWLLSVNNAKERSKQERFSELYRGFFRKNSFSSSVGRSTCREVPAKKPKLEAESRYPTCGLVEEKEEEVFVEAEEVAGETDGDGGKRDLADVQGDRNDEGLCSQPEKAAENVDSVGKSLQRKPRPRRVKEKEDDTAAPQIVGRVTRSRAKQCQILGSAKEETGKRKAVQLSGPKQPQIGRNTRARHKDLAKSSSPVATKMQVEDGTGIQEGVDTEDMVQGSEGKLGPLRTDCRGSSKSDSNGAQQLETLGRVEESGEGSASALRADWRASCNGDQLQEASKMVESEQYEETEKPADFEETGEKCPTGLKGTIQLQDDSSMAGKCMEERIPSCKSQAVTSIVPVDSSSAGKATCTPGEMVPSERHESSSGKAGSSCRSQARMGTMASSAGKLTCTSGEAMPFECHELSFGKAGISWKSQDGMSILPVDPCSVAKAMCVYQEGITRKCDGSASGKAGLLDEGLKSTPPSPQAISYNCQAHDSGKPTRPPLEAITSKCHKSSSGKAGLFEEGLESAPHLLQAMPYNCQAHTSVKASLSDASGFSKAASLSPLSGRLMTSGMRGSVPGNAIALDDPDGSALKLSGHKLLPKGNASVMPGLKVLLKIESEGTEADEMSCKKIDISPGDPIAEKEEGDTTLQLEGDDGLGLSCHKLNKDCDCIMLDSTNICKNSLQKTATPGNHLLDCQDEAGTAMIEKREQYCNKQVPSSKIRSSYGFSESLLSQGSAGQKLNFWEASASNCYCNGVNGKSDGLLVLKNPGPAMKNFRSTSLDACVYQNILHGSFTPVSFHQMGAGSSQQIVSSKNLNDSHYLHERSELLWNPKQGERHLSSEAGVSGSESQPDKMEFRTDVCIRLGHESCLHKGLSSEKKQGHIIPSHKISLPKDSHGKEIASGQGNQVPVCESVLQNISDHYKGQFLEGNLSGERERPASLVEVSPKEHEMSQMRGLMPDQLEAMQPITGNVDKAYVSTPKPSLSQSMVRDNDSVLTNFHQDGVSEGQNEALCSVPRGHSSVDSNINFLSGPQLNSARLFSRNMFHIKEEGLMKQHVSWPNHQERRRKLQQVFHTTSQSRLCQSEAHLNTLDYDTSTRLPNGDIAPVSNRTGLLSKFDHIIPYAFGSKTYDERENCEQRNDSMLVITLQRDFSSPGVRSSSGTYPDQLHVSIPSSQLKDDQEQFHSDNDFREEARLLLEEQLKSKECCSSIKSQLYQGQSGLAALIERSHVTGNDSILRSSPSHKSSSKTKEHIFCLTTSSLSQADSLLFGVPGISASAACSQDQAQLCVATFETHSFRTSFEVESPRGGSKEGDCKLLHSDDPVAEFSFQKGLSGIENGEMRITPLLKRTADEELAPCSITNVLRDNNRSSSQCNLAEQEPADIDAAISEFSPARKKSPSLEAICDLQVNFSMDGLAKGKDDMTFQSKPDMGAGRSLLMQEPSQPCCSFSLTNQAVDLIGHSQLIQGTKLGSFHDREALQEFERYNHIVFSGDRKFDPEKGNDLVGKDTEHGETQGEHRKHSISSLTPTPNHMMKFRKLTQSGLHWDPATELQEFPEHSGEDSGKSYAFHDSYAAVSSSATGKVRTLTPSHLHCFPATKLQGFPECSGAYWGKDYAFNDSYTAMSRSSTDKLVSTIGFNGGMGFGRKVKNPAPLTPRKPFDRISTNSMDTDSNLLSKQVPMNIERAPCFRIEEEIAIEDENEDTSVTVDESKKIIGSSTKKRVLGAHNALMDSGFANQNSPMMTPARGKLFERISSNSMDTGSNQKQAKSFDLEGIEKENRDSCVHTNRVQKEYGSSIKKQALRSQDARTDRSIVRQNSSARSNHKSNNILSDVKSFIPLVQQKQTTAAILTGKRDIKVKALEAAEAAKRLEEKREQERKMRKELARREHEKIFHERPIDDRFRGEREAEETSRATSDCSNKSISSGVVRKKPMGSTLTKYHLEQLDGSACGVDFKLKRALEAKTKLQQEKLRKLEEEQKRKEEERKKKEAEFAAKKRKREEVEKKEREDKRKRLEEAQRQQKELEEQMRAEKEEKEQRRKVVDGFERKRKAMEEEAKKQRRIEKEKEAAERRRRIEEGARSAKLAPKDAKHLEEIHQCHETLEAQKAHVGQASSTCNNFAKLIQPEMEGQAMSSINGRLLQSEKLDYDIQSYEISPYKGSDDEDEDDEDVAPGKFIPLWARKEHLIPHLINQQCVDPDEIFTGAKTCSLNEVFGTTGSYKRRDFNRRSQSGEWLNDSFTWKEEYQYKLKMGYINHG